MCLIRVRAKLYRKVDLASQICESLSLIDQNLKAIVHLKTSVLSSWLFSSVRKHTHTLFSIRVIQVRTTWRWLNEDWIVYFWVNYLLNSTEGCECICTPVRTQCCRRRYRAALIRKWRKKKSCTIHEFVGCPHLLLTPLTASKNILYS